jgi:hypothetical protein
VIALCNAGPTDPDAFTDGLTKIIAPALVKKSPAPIADTDPAMTKRTARLFREAAAGKLSRAELVHLTDEQLAGLATFFKEKLPPFGDPISLVPIGRREAQRAASIFG